MLLENILLLFQEKKWDKDFRSGFLCCSGQFRCNGAWNRAAGKTQYSASLLRQNILTQTLSWKTGGKLCINIFQCAGPAAILFQERKQFSIWSKSLSHSWTNTQLFVLVYPPLYTSTANHNVFCKKQNKNSCSSFYSFSLNLVSQASTSSQDIHAFNFTDPPFSFETTLCSFSKNIDQY